MHKHFSDDESRPHVGKQKKNSLQQMQTLSLCVDEKCIYLYKKKKSRERAEHNCWIWLRTLAAAAGVDAH